jgi:hypothetical protein
VISIDRFVNAWFRFTPGDDVVVNENFGIMGYDSWNLLQTLDTVIMLVAGIIVSVIVTFLVD